MNKQLYSQSGFSLVQGMILAAALAGSALVATRLLSDQKMAQKTMETRDQIEDLHAIVYSTLQQRENCTATFSGNLGGPGSVISRLTTGASPDMLNNVTLQSGEVSVRRFRTVARDGVDDVLNVTDANRNTYMNGNILVTGLDLTYSALPQSVARLRVTYERLTDAGNKRTKKGYGAKTITKEIPIRVQRNPFTAGKPFVACYAVTGEIQADGTLVGVNDINEEFCTEMNGGITGDGSSTGLNVFVWDPTTNTCMPNSKCPDHMVYTGFTATGNVICKTIQQLMTEAWSDIFQPTVGTCGPAKTVKLIASPDRTSVAIHCL